MKNKNKLKWVGIGGLFAGILATSVAIPLATNNGKKNKIIVENKNLKINAKLANNIINPILEWIFSITETELTEYLENPDYNKQVIEGISNLFGLEPTYFSNVTFSKGDQGSELIISPSQYLSIELDEDVASSGLPISLNNDGEIVISNLNFVSLINLTQNNINLFANELIQRVNKAKISLNYFSNQINNEYEYQQIYNFFDANNSGNIIEQYDYIQEISASNNVVTIIPKSGIRFNVISNTYNNNVIIENGCIVINNVPFANIIEANIINLNYRSLVNVHNNIASQVSNSSIEQAISLLNEPSNQTQIINFIATNIGCDSTYINKVVLSKDGNFNIEPANGYEFRLNDDLSNTNPYLDYEYIFKSIKLNAIGNLVFSGMVYKQNNTIVVNVDKYYKLCDYLNNLTWPSNATISMINNLLNENNAKEKIASFLSIDQTLIENMKFVIDNYNDKIIEIIFPKNYYVVFTNPELILDEPQWLPPKSPLGKEYTIPLRINNLKIYNNININKLSEQINLINFTNGGGVFTREYFRKSSSQINGYNGGELKFYFSYGSDNTKYVNFCNLIGIESTYDIDVKIYVDNSNYFNIEIYSGTPWATDIDFGSNGIGTINGNKLTYRQQLKSLKQGTNIDISINQNLANIKYSDNFLDYNNIEEVENLINNSPQNKQAFLNALTVSPNNIQANQVQNIQLVHSNFCSGTIIKNKIGNIYEHYDVVITPVEGTNFNIIANNYGVQNNGYLIFDGLIFAKTNRVAIDTVGIEYLIYNYNNGSSLLNNSNYFNSDGFVKQEHLPKFIKELLAIRIYNPTTGSFENNRDDLFTLVPTLSNIFKSLSVSFICSKPVYGFSNIRIDIQKSSSDFLLLPSSHINDYYSSIASGNTFSYFCELPQKIPAESSNLKN